MKTTMTEPAIVVGYQHDWTENGGDVSWDVMVPRKNSNKVITGNVIDKEQFKVSLFIDCDKNVVCRK